MARNQTRTAQETEPVTVDIIDQLTNKLSEIGVEFVRDAWMNRAPDNYGVVELQGEQKQLWGDGHLTDSIWRVIVTLYVGDDDDTWADKVQAKLSAMEADGQCELTHTNTREFAYDIGKVSWKWTVYVYGPLTRTEAASDGVLDG